MLNNIVTSPLLTRTVIPAKAVVDRPFDRLTVLSKVDGLTVLSNVEGESSEIPCPSVVKYLPF